MAFVFCRYFHTLRYLRLIQVYFQVYYRIKRIWQIALVCLPKSPAIETLFITKLIIKEPFSNTLASNEQLSIHNIEVPISAPLNWNEKRFGKLWCYQLNYFDFLFDKGLLFKTKIKWIEEYIESTTSTSVGQDPYPLSVRTFNWVLFIQLYESKIPELTRHKIAKQIWTDTVRLTHTLEYHLLGNHLLENGFALLMSGVLFQKSSWLRKSTHLICQQLSEQILQDGMHFERSPMYHVHVLYRVLTSLDLVRGASALKSNDLLVKTLHNVALSMLSALKNLQFSNDDIAFVNDSCFGQVPPVAYIQHYAKMLGLMPDNLKLGASNYRKLAGGQWEAFIDVGDTQPDYIPAHVHSDIFNFIVYAHHSPLIVDTGISTYEKNAQRHLERSTKSHNTVEVENTNQSDVWSGFRIGKRARVIDLQEQLNYIRGVHNGYKKFGILHQREFRFAKEVIEIKDTMLGNTSHSCCNYLHFHPDIKNIHISEDTIVVDKIIIHVSGADKIELRDYDFAPEFNKLVKGKVAVMTFNQEMKYVIEV